MYYRLFILVFKEIKLIASATWVFYGSYFVRLFVMFFKFGLILLRYYSTNSVLFLSHDFHVWYDQYYKSYLLLLTCLLLGQVDFQHLYFFCLWWLYFFSGLKSFLIILIPLSSISFFPKRFLTSLIMLSSISFIFLKLSTIHHYRLWKKTLTFIRNKNLL